MLADFESCEEEAVAGLEEIPSADQSQKWPQAEALLETLIGTQIECDHQKYVYFGTCFQLQQFLLHESVFFSRFARSKITSSHGQLMFYDLSLFNFHSLCDSNQSVCCLPTEEVVTTFTLTFSIFKSFADHFRVDFLVTNGLVEQLL